MTATEREAYDQQMRQVAPDKQAAAPVGSPDGQSRAERLAAIPVGHGEQHDGVEVERTDTSRWVIYSRERDDHREWIGAAETPRHAARLVDLVIADQAAGRVIDTFHHDGPGGDDAMPAEIRNALTAIAPGKTTMIGGARVTRQQDGHWQVESDANLASPWAAMQSIHGFRHLPDRRAHELVESHFTERELADGAVAAERIVARQALEWDTAARAFREITAAARTKEEQRKRAQEALRDLASHADDGQGQRAHSVAGTPTRRELAERYARAESTVIRGKDRFTIAESALTEIASGVWREQGQRRRAQEALLHLQPLNG